MASIANTTSWTCAACMNDFIIPGADQSYVFGEDEYCFPCLKNRMDMLLASSAGHPCQIGGVTLDPGMFPAALFGGEEEFEKYKHRFNMKQTEWATPIEHRLYCHCEVGMFIGALVDHRTGNVFSFEGCGSCFQRYCMKCAEKVDEMSMDDIRAHRHCQHTEAARRAEETEQQLSGLIRGVDYQMCPTCKTRVQRAVGCNHMTCPDCSAHFCYVCGCPAAGNSAHWRSVNIPIGEKCLFSGVDRPGAAKGPEKRAAAGIV